MQGHTENGVKEALDSAPLPDDQVRLRTGVVLRIVQPSLFAVTEVQRQMAREAPAVPTVRNVDQDRDEPNESDPDYIRAKEAHDALLGTRLYDVALVTGTEVVSVPEGFPTIDSDEWVDDLAFLGITAAPGGKARHSQWIKYIAAKETDEFTLLLKLVMGRIGTSEEEVAEALETFPGVATRGIPDTANRP